MKYAIIVLLFISFNLQAQKIDRKIWIPLNDNFSMKVIYSTASRTAENLRMTSTSIAKKGYRLTTVHLQIKNISQKKLTLDLTELQLVDNTNNTQKIGGIHASLKIANKAKNRFFKFKSGKKKNVVIKGLFSQPIPKENHIIGLLFNDKLVPFIFKKED